MAKIDTGLIEGYADMTPEQKIAALEAFTYEDNAAELERYKNAVSKANSECADWKKKHNALLSEEERKQQANAEELESLKKELADMKLEKTIAGNKAQLIALGYEEALASDTAKAMADGDAMKVFANQKKFLESHDKAYKAQLMGEGSKPPAGTVGKQTSDYSKLIEDAQAKGDFAAAAYYTRLQGQDKQTE